MFFFKIVVWHTYVILFFSKREIVLECVYADTKQIRIRSILLTAQKMSLVVQKNVYKQNIILIHKRSLCLTAN